MGFPGGSAGKESACNVGDLGSIPGLGRSPGRERLPTPVFWPGEFHELYGPWGHKEVDTTERFSLNPVFLPEESHGWRSLVSYSPWGQKDSDMTEWLSTVQEQSERLNYNNLTRLSRKKRGLRKHLKI